MESWHRHWWMTRGRRPRHRLPLQGERLHCRLQTQGQRLRHLWLVGAQGVVGDVGASISPRVIDVDPISAMPGGAEEDLVRDQA
jgi:hypothetical protein